MDPFTFLWFFWCGALGVLAGHSPNPGAALTLALLFIVLLGHFLFP